MVRISIFLLLSIFISFHGFSQKDAVQKLSPEAALELSKNHLQKAKWFLEIPQYNYDSALYYINVAMAQLNEKESLHYPQIAQIYLLRFTDFSQVGLNLDSLAQKGWSYVLELTDDEENRMLKYRYCMEWAHTKLEAAQQDQARKLFQNALSYVSANEDPEFHAIVLMDKGHFYNRYKLKDEKEIALSYLLESYAYFNKLDKVKNAKSFFTVAAMLANHYLSINPDSVYYYRAKQSLVLEAIKDPRKLAVYHCTLGRELITNPLPGKKVITEKQYEEGRAHINQALDILDTYQVKNSLDIYPYCYGLLADLSLKNRAYDEAILNYKKSYEGYLRAGNINASISMLSFISNAYRQKGDFENAFEYKEQFYQESLKFEEVRNERGLRESELQVNVLTQKQELEKKDNQQKLFIAGTAIGLVLLGLIFYNYRLKQKSIKRFETLNHDLESKNNLLDKRNAENELLLKEIHHRVKNNLEVVSSLLALQSAQIDDVQTKEAMLEGQNRVNSIGIVHQKLYQGENLGAIEMKDYFLNLGENIIDTFGANQKVELELAMDKLNVDIDTAVPLGLIVNELLTNTLKYAFTPGQNGKVSIKLEKQSNGTLHLEVADNGKGKSGVTKGTGFGTQLVVLLTKQLNGIMREENLDGTRIIFDFKG